jgi:hypothetical protein
MKKMMMALACAFLLAAGFAALSNAGVTVPDTDSDGVPDEWDNCLLDANPSQIDSDLDGIGNVCDCDFNNDGVCGGGDFLLFGTAFGLGTVPPADPNADMNGDGVVGGGDFLLFGAGVGGGIPGPSGLACADPTGATAPCVGV